MMTAHYKDTRHYAVPRARIFQACLDVLQPSGFLLTASDPQSGTIAAISSDGPFSYRPDSGLLEEIGLRFFAGPDARSKFRERISIEIDAHCNVQVFSVSEPSFMMGDQGRNRKHVITLWQALDEVLVHSQGVSMTFTNDNSVTIKDNIGPVQNASPHAQQSASPGVHQQMRGDSRNLDQVLRFLAEVTARVDQLELGEAESAELEADIATIRAQAASPKPKHHIIRESLGSVRTTLENASGGAAAVGLLDLVHHLNILGGN